jgi:raffinose/stachyose/melibiose transport system permease protein
MVKAGRPGNSPINFSAYLYILPALLFYGIFILYPIVNTLRYSFFSWTGFSQPVFIGFKNYLDLLNDPGFLKAISNNFKFIIFYSVFPILIALLLTALMTRRNLRGLNLFRAGFFIPYIMPMVVVGVVWRWIYNPVFGLLNSLLREVGLDMLARPWLGDFSLAQPAVGVVATWVQYGFCMTLFIAGVQKIDESLFDAAKVDGANGFQQLLYITIPGIKPEILVAAISTFIAALRAFDLVFVTTRGGPGTQTVVTSLLLYQNAFQINRVGYAAAIAVLQSAAILIISYLLLYGFRKQEDRVA